eukprot:6189481-Pleurochrysis_carterae.AAC.3
MRAIAASRSFSSSSACASLRAISASRSCKSLSAAPRPAAPVAAAPLALIWRMRTPKDSSSE